MYTGEGEVVRTACCTGEGRSTTDLVLIGGLSSTWLGKKENIK